MADRTGIELARVGQWNLSTGPLAVTADMLQRTAAKSAGPFFRAAVKLGHTDPRNDGEPAFGWLHNLRAEGHGDQTVLLGDVTGMPQWLADIAPDAYPDRSIEGFVEAGPDGDDLTITALALLGVTPPGMDTIATWRDLPSALGVAASRAVAIPFRASHDKPQPDTNPNTPPSEETGMPDLIPELRKRLGVAPDADEDTVLRALDEALAEQAEPAPTPQPDPAPQPEPAPVPDGGPELELVRQELAASRARIDQLEAARRTDERGQYFETQARRGVFASADERGRFEQLWDSNPQLVRELLDGRRDGFGLPLAASGQPGTAEHDLDDLEQDADYRRLHGIDKAGV